MRSRPAAKAQARRGATERPSAGCSVTDKVTLDGYKFVMEDGGWLLVRFSGTEPLIRVYCETMHGDKVQAILHDGMRLAGLE